MSTQAYKKSPAIRGKGIAGFLLGNYIRNKTSCILISYIFISLICLSLTNGLYGLEVNSSFYAVDLITFAQGGGAFSSANNEAVYSVVGESIGSLTELISNKFTLLSGQLYLILPPAPWKERVLIADLRALTEVLGSPILEATWQKDNDPYFYWSILTEPLEGVAGFSVSLDTPPAHQINTTTTYYQFAEDSIPSGKHTFYVLPFTSGIAWDEDSLLKFELWVDVDPPAISQLRPLPGSTTSDSFTAISCNLSDAHSGIDPVSTTLTLNDSTLSFTYDAQNNLLKSTATSSLSEGKNTIFLKAYDMVGNYVVKGWDFIIDTRAPTGGIKINNGQELTHSAYVSINIVVEEVISGIKHIYLSNDGIFDTELNQPRPYAAVIPGWLLSQPDVDGAKTVYAKFEDQAGNLSPIYQASITLKLLTPDTRIISGPQSSTEETSANFKFEASKAGCKFSYKLDNQDWSEWSSPAEASFSGLVSGNHYFYVKAGLDLNGDSKLTIDEEDATPAQWVWTIKGVGEPEKEKILFYRR